MQLLLVLDSAFAGEESTASYFECSAVEISSNSSDDFRILSKKTRDDNLISFTRILFIDCLLGSSIMTFRYKKFFWCKIFSCVKKWIRLILRVFWAFLILYILSYVKVDIGIETRGIGDHSYVCLFITAILRWWENERNQKCQATHTFRPPWRSTTRNLLPPLAHRKQRAGALSLRNPAWSISVSFWTWVGILI